MEATGLRNTIFKGLSIAQQLNMNPLSWLLDKKFYALFWEDVSESSIGKAIPMSVQDFINSMFYFATEYDWNMTPNENFSIPPSAQQVFHSYLSLWINMQDTVSQVKWLDNAKEYLIDTDAFFGLKVIDDFLEIGIPNYAFRSVLGMLNSIADAGKMVAEFCLPMERICRVLRIAGIFGTAIPGDEIRESVRDIIIKYGFTNYDEYETVESCTKEVLNAIKNLDRYGFLKDFADPNVRAVLMDDVSVVPDKFKLAFGEYSFLALARVISVLPSEQKAFVCRGLWLFEDTFKHYGVAGVGMHAARAPFEYFWTVIKGWYFTPEGRELMQEWHRLLKERLDLSSDAMSAYHFWMRYQKGEITKEDVESMFAELKPIWQEWWDNLWEGDPNFLVTITEDQVDEFEDMVKDLPDPIVNEFNTEVLQAEVSGLDVDAGLEALESSEEAPEINPYTSKVIDIEKVIRDIGEFESRG
jgi:hypothetical protein